MAAASTDGKVVVPQRARDVAHSLLGVWLAPLNVDLRFLCLQDVVTHVPGSPLDGDLETVLLVFSDD